METMQLEPRVPRRRMCVRFLGAAGFALFGFPSASSAQEPPVEAPPAEPTPAPEAPPAETTPEPEPAPAPEETPPPAEPAPTTAQATQPPQAADLEKEKKKENVQQLGEHMFPAPAFIPWSFVSTNFTFSQGVLRLDVPEFPLRFDLSRDVAMIGLTETVQFGARFIDPLEIFILAGGQMLVGDDVDSIFTLGANYSYNVGAGATWRFLRLQATQFSLRGRVTYNSGGSIELLRLIDEIQEVDAVELFNQDARQVVLEDTSRRDFSAFVLTAQSLGKHFGLQAALGISRATFVIAAFDTAEGRDVEVTRSDWEPEGGLALDATLEPWVPIGFALEYSLRSRRYDDVTSSESESSIAHLIGVGIHTVHPHFQITLTSGHLIGVEPLRRTVGGEELSSGDPTITYGQLGIRTFW